MLEICLILCENELKLSAKMGLRRLNERDDFVFKKICAALLAASLAVSACAVSAFAEEAIADKYGVIGYVTGAQMAEDEGWTWDNSVEKRAEGDSLFMGAIGDINAGNFTGANISDMLDGKELPDGTYKIVFLAQYTYVKDKTEPFIIKLYGEQSSTASSDSLTFTQTELQPYDGEAISMVAVVDLSGEAALNYAIGGWHSSAFGGKIDKVVLASADCDVISAFPDYTLVKEAPIGGNQFSGVVEEGSWTVSDGTATYAPDVTGVTLSQTNVSVTIGSTVQLTAAVQPADTDETVEWSSLNEDVATVDANGVVTGVKEGIATIKASAGGIEAICFVEVKQKAVTPATVAVTGVKASKTSVSLVAGKSTTVKVTVSPSNATDKTVQWSSSKPSVASVSNGKITAKKPGKAVITVKTGGKTATIKVTVKPKQVTNLKVTAKMGKAVIKFKKVTGATKYQVVFTSGKKTVKKTVKKSGKTIKIKKGSYKVKVRAYGAGQYGKYSKNVKVKVK